MNPTDMFMHPDGQFANPDELIAQCFPDGEIKTECFGLQCLGFDQRLYSALRERFQPSVQWRANNKKRPMSEELRGGKVARSRS
jgi:hypothetical protein